MKISLLWAARRPLQFLFKEIVDIRVQAGVFSDIRYEIRDGMLNISFFFYPGINKWISIHRDLLRDFVLDNENKSHGT